MEYAQQIQRQMAMTSGNTNQQSSPSLSSEIQNLREELQNQKNHFERFQQITKNRIMTLEKEVSELRDGFLKTKEYVDKIKDKEVVQATRQQFNNRQERAPSDQPIDRNGVAPSDVQITKIFNCSGKKF